MVVTSDWESGIPSWVYIERVSGDFIVVEYFQGFTDGLIGGTSVGFECPFDEPHSHLAAVVNSSSVCVFHYIVRIGHEPRVGAVMSVACMEAQV